MLADVIASNPGIWLADEPFAMFPNHPGYALKQRLLPEREHSQFFALNPTELEQFDRFANGLLTARYRELGTCRRLHQGVYADRVCMKILNAPWMLDWFLEREDVDCIFHDTPPGVPGALSHSTGLGLCRGSLFP